MPKKTEKPGETMCWATACLGGGRGVNLTQCGQASVTLQPDSGLFNSLGAGVIKLTVYKWYKIKQFNSLT